MFKTNVDLSLIARGPHKKAIKENGLTLIKEGKSENFKLKVTDDPKTLDVQDYIFISVKAHVISNIIDSLKNIIGEKTSIVSAVNGLPWWYFYKANTGTNLPLYTRSNELLNRWLEMNAFSPFLRTHDGHLAGSPSA